VGLLERVAEARGRPGSDLEKRFSADQYLAEYLMPAQGQFMYGGSQYPYGLNMTWTAARSHEITSTLPGYVAALRTCPPAFAAEQFRAMVLSQSRFTFRRKPSSSTSARKTFGTKALDLLENPWPNATTGELIARMEWHAGLAGNAYVYRQAGRLRVLRPDWIVIVWGSQQEPDDAAHALDGQLLGYIYCNGGIHSGNEIHTLLPQDVAHWSPIPDPESAGIGMSWVTPAVRDIMGDKATADHKLKFFENGATPNLVVKGIQAAKQEQFEDIVDKLEARHSGLGNAYKTLYLSAGADATVVGADLRQLDFKNVVEAGENRIAFLSRVPASLLGLSQGMKGSSLNAGNFKMAQRSFTDSWLMPTLQDMCAALAPIVDVPTGAELWFDPTDVGLMREDSTAAAQINEIQARTITILVREGFTAESSIAAVVQQDMSLLVHTNLISVQLQEPGAPPGGGHYVPVGTGPKAPPGEAP
jgi:phage portal protein BeeE